MEEFICEYGSLMIYIVLASGVFKALASIADFVFSGGLWF